MAIVSSVLALNLLQADGSRIVHEQHTDSNGVVHELRYQPGASVDISALLAVHAAEIVEQLALVEFEENIRG